MRKMSGEEMSQKQWGHGYHTGIEKGMKEIGYVGLFFHFYDENGMEKRQGIVRKQIDDKKYLISYFSYFDGTLNKSEIIELPENATFYKTAQEIRKAHIEHIKNGKLPIPEIDREQAVNNLEFYENVFGQMR